MSKALIVVDMQNDFVSPNGSLYVPGAETIVQPIRNLISDWITNENNNVFLTQDWHPAETPHFDIWPVHCVQNTNGAYLVNYMRDMPYYLIQKGQGQTNGYSGFENPELDLLLNTRMIDATELTIVGVAADYCVKATALDGVKLGYEVTVIESLTRFVEQDPAKQAVIMAEMVERGISFR